MMASSALLAHWGPFIMEGSGQAESKEVPTFQQIQYIQAIRDSFKPSVKTEILRGTNQNHSVPRFVSPNAG